MSPVIYVILSTFVICSSQADEKNPKDPKLVSVFQVVKFKNDICAGSTRNGTCYTAAECDNISGLASGTCADGFGVCCIVTLSAGGTSSSLNNSYITQTAFTTGASTYTICPCGDNICRIKFDFTTFELAGPHTRIGTALEAVDTQFASQRVIGSCNVDTFQIASPCGPGSPLICGTNQNQHMIIDVGCGQGCVTVNLGIGLTSTTTRSLDIKVIQYACGDLDNGGPPGCLQYLTATTGKIKTYNFGEIAQGANIDAFRTHLKNQHYKHCIRRANANKFICFTPCTSTKGTTNGADIAVITQNSFGLSLSPAEAAQSQVDVGCISDYIWIRSGSSQFGNLDETAETNAIVASTQQLNRFCGRYLATSTGQVVAAQVSVCSYSVPFQVGVDTDDYEVCTANANGDNCEEATGPANTGGGGGIVGFSLCYTQHASDD